MYEIVRSEKFATNISNFIYLRIFSLIEGAVERRISFFFFFELIFSLAFIIIFIEYLGIKNIRIENSIRLILILP